MTPGVGMGVMLLPKGYVGDGSDEYLPRFYRKPRRELVEGGGEVVIVGGREGELTDPTGTKVRLVTEKGYFAGT